jgi:hypothetical protein
MGADADAREIPGVVQLAGLLDRGAEDVVHGPDRDIRVEHVAQKLHDPPV